MGKPLKNMLWQRIGTKARIDTFTGAPQKTTNTAFNYGARDRKKTINQSALHRSVEGLVPDVFCAKRASWMTASLGWTTVVDTGVGAEEVSISRGTGEPSRDRLSGV